MECNSQSNCNTADVVATLRGRGIALPYTWNGSLLTGALQSHTFGEKGSRYHSHCSMPIRSLTSTRIYTVARHIITTYIESEGLNSIQAFCVYVRVTLRFNFAGVE